MQHCSYVNIWPTYIKRHRNVNFQCQFTVFSDWQRLIFSLLGNGPPPSTGLLLVASAVTELPRYITAMKLAYPVPDESRLHHVPKPYLHIHPSVTKTASF